jgi:hypothetical protein
MGYQNISERISEHDMQEIRQALALVQSKLPFLVALSTHEKRRMVKLGPKSMDFVQGCQHTINNYHDILPAHFNAEEFNKDVDLYKQLSELQMMVSNLSEKISDTHIAVGNEALSSSLSVYDYVKAAVKSRPGLKSVMESLGQRFRGQGKKKEE